MRPDWSVYGWSIRIQLEGCQQKIVWETDLPLSVDSWRMNAASEHERRIRP